MNTILKRRKYLAILIKTLIKALYKNSDNSDCGNYRGITTVSIGSKLLSMTILFRLKEMLQINFSNRKGEMMRRPNFHS